MKKKLIIFTHGGGRLANQMTNHAHLIAFQKEHSNLFEVVNIAFGPFGQLFREMQSRKIPQIPHSGQRLRAFTSIVGQIVKPREYKMTFFNQVLRLIHCLFGILPFSQSIKYGRESSYLKFLPGKSLENFDFNSLDTLNILKEKRITALAGWPIRSWELFRKHEAIIRSSFAIRNDFMRNAESLINPLKSKYDILCGVLIRQDDYRTWAKGMYFFSTEEYVVFMKQVANSFPNQKIGFVIASDELQEPQKFEALNVYFTSGAALGSAHFIESFAELSLCDYVMTPPSTFGVWAAFLGNVPIIPIYESDQDIKSANFLKNHIYDCLEHPHMSVSVS